MATETAQFEQQALENADRELAQAIDAFEERLHAYEVEGERLISQMDEYRTKRRNWLR